MDVDPYKTKKATDLATNFLNFVNDKTNGLRNRREFTKYLMTIRATELYDCWNMINTTLEDPEDIDMYLYVHNRFLLTTSSEHINLTSDMNKRVGECFVSYENMQMDKLRELFKDIKNVLFMDIVYDSYKRFVEKKKHFKIRKTISTPSEMDVAKVTFSPEPKRKTIQNNEDANQTRSRIIKTKDDSYLCKKTVSLDENVLRKLSIEVKKNKATKYWPN